MAIQSDFQANCVFLFKSAFLSLEVYIHGLYFNGGHIQCECSSHEQSSINQPGLIRSSKLWWFCINVVLCCSLITLDKISHRWGSQADLMLHISSLFHVD